MAAELSVPVAHQFDDARQQHEAAAMGMWIFLATEILFFGGLFTGYAVYRAVEPQGFHEASRHLDLLLGTLNTGLLLTSSLTMALAVLSAENGRRRATIGWLLSTSVLGLGFLAIKGYEYAHKVHEHLWPGPHFVAPPDINRGFEQFFILYVSMTGLHAVHMAAGLVVMWVMVIVLWRSRHVARHANFVEMFGLYWHFVDIVWIFLFPLLYLIDRT